MSNRSHVDKQRCFLITGSRKHENLAVVRRVLHDFYVNSLMPDLIIVGGAKGVDTEAEQWGERFGRAVLRWPSDNQNVRADLAPLARNGAMVDMAKTLSLSNKWQSVCVAFPSGEARGTRHCARYALSRGLTTLAYRPTATDSREIDHQWLRSLELTQV